MRPYFLIISLCLLVNVLKSQNLVPNSSFEEVGRLPISPNPKNSYQYEPLSGYKPFQKNLKYWYAGTKTTPDLRIFHDKRYRDCEKRHQDCDRPRTGDYMVGIITSMKNTYTNSYREYIQIKLKKPLRPGVKTFAELWVIKEREAKLVTNNIGFYFSRKTVFEETEEVLALEPQINEETVINRDGQTWVKIQGTFIPDRPMSFVTIGNFFNNENTQLETYEHYTASPYIPPYAYYLIDDVRIWQEGDEPERPAFDLAAIKKDEPVQLKNITFKFDSAELESSSFVELNKLFQLLQAHPEVNIAIHGHTDNRGNDAYNLELSKARAKAVFDYLIEKEIGVNRLQFEGFGEEKPLEPNDTEEGRTVNRRVEFIILSEKQPLNDG